MEDNFFSLEEIQSTLSRLRQDPNTKNKFPRQLWNSIIHLTKTRSSEEVCRLLHIQPAYLKHKMQQRQETSLEFHEISIKSAPEETVMIELYEKSSLRAKIQGPVTCLNYLQQLFGR